MIQEKGGDDYILVQVAENVRTGKIIEEFINPQTGKPFTRGMLWYWKKMDPERDAAWTEARKIAAHNLMEDAAEDMDATGNLVTPADVALLKEKNSFRKYLAERYNREEYGAQDPNAAAVNVNVNLGDAFRAMLHQHGNAHRLHATEVQEAEILPAEEPAALTSGGDE